MGGFKTNHLVFICSWGQVRSVCGYNLFKELYPCHYFGLSGDPQIDHLDEWCTEADMIFVMTEGHISYFKKYHPEYLPKIHNLHIDDLWGDPNHHILKMIMFNKVKKILNKDQPDPRLDDYDISQTYCDIVTEYDLNFLKDFYEKIEKK